MRKGALILSLVLTAVVLALLFRLVSTYRQTIETSATMTPTQVQEQALPQQSAQPNLTPVDAPAVESVSIFDAAVIAANVLGHKDVYLAEYTQFNGTDAYLVTFLSGDLVYVSMDGQVVSASKQNPIHPHQPVSHR